MPYRLYIMAAYSFAILAQGSYRFRSNNGGRVPPSHSVVTDINSN